MSNRKFTQEEMDILRANKYTYGVIPTVISFTAEFKQEFWYRLQQGKRGCDIVRELDTTLKCSVKPEYRELNKLLGLKPRQVLLSRETML